MADCWEGLLTLMYGDDIDGLDNSTLYVRACMCMSVSSSMRMSMHSRTWSRT